MMDWIYIAISWILLRWHQLWDLILPGGATFLATNWDWILAIVFLVITVRIILFPIFVKQIRSQRAMQALQPKMKELQEKYKGDQQTLRQEMMKLYQTEKVNPLMGCLPMFLQIPVFLGLFHVLQRLDPVQTKNTTLYGWTQQQWDSAAVARLFDAPIAARFADGVNQLGILQADGTTVKVVAGVLVLIMMSTTFLTSRQMILKTGWQQDPQQRMIQKLMLYGIPLSLLLSGWYFPIGVIIYWVTQNIFSLGQQYWVLHKYPPPVTASTGKASTDAVRKSAVARFFAGEPVRSPEPPPARTGGVASPVQPASRSGLFRRKVEPILPPPAEPRSLGPKPGAKPAQQSKATKPAAAAPAEADATSTTSGSNGAGSGGATPSTTASSGAVSSDTVSSDAVSGGAVSSDTVSGGAVSGGAVSGGAVSGGAVSGGKASGTTASGTTGSSGAASNGSGPNSANPPTQSTGSGSQKSGAQKSGAQKSGAQKSGAQKSGGQKSGAQRSGAQRKSTPTRKGAGSKKGGPRR